jgi:hypothetical protein
MESNFYLQSKSEHQFNNVDLTTIRNTNVKSLLETYIKICRQDIIILNLKVYLAISKIFLFILSLPKPLKVICHAHSSKQVIPL